MEKRGKAKVKQIRGLVNLVRVGLVHAHVSGISQLSSKNTHVREGLLASRQMPPEVVDLAETVEQRQKEVLIRTFRQEPELMKIAARVGWSIETQRDILQWLTSLEDWQIKQFGTLVVNGAIRDKDKLSFLIGPLSNHISEFEGEKLGGFTSYISTKWIEGIPLTEIRDQQEKEKDFGKLVRVIYSRVQYLLPWALYGLHELATYESRRRGFKISTGIKDLSVLAAEGVPTFAALTLVLRLGIERVDATRLAAAHAARGSATDIIGWIKGAEWAEVERTVRGSDRRRLDPDLKGVWTKVREGGQTGSKTPR